MNNSIIINLIKKLALFFLVVMMIVFNWPISLWSVIDKDASKQIPQAHAIGSYYPTGGALVTGTEAAQVNGGTSGNIGSWRGALGYDAVAPGFNWTVNVNTASGLDQQLFVDGVNLNDANVMEVALRTVASSATISRVYQICDWVSTANVDTVAGGNCTGGGWRTLNINETNITGTTNIAPVWHVYDGFFTTTSTSNTPVSTPLSNFIKNDATKRVLIRAYSTTTGTTATHTLDYLRIDPVVDPVYMAANLTQISGGTVSGSYISTIGNLITGQTASDNARISVPGTASAISDFYFSYNNVETYTGMNTIVVVSEYSCSNTGINIKPKIYNFNTTSWEDLTSATIACSTTDATRQFAKNNITISDYISGGEIRVGWYGSANNVLSIRVDFQYIILGTTNTDSSLCEISFGTGTATNCTNARTLDSLASASTWQPTTILESAATSSRYALDNDADATGGEAAWSVNSTFSGITVPTNASVVGIGFATRWRPSSTVTTVTTQPQMKDYFGNNATISGGWTAAGSTTNATTSYVYSDVYTAVANSWIISNPDDYIDTVNGYMNMRIRTTASTAVANMTGDVDFMFATFRWVTENPARPTARYQYLPTGGTLVTGTEAAQVNGGTSGNIGSWRGALAIDATSPGFNWTVNVNTASGLDQQLTFGGVEQNNANKAIIVLRANASSATIARLYQICDWVSTSSVDNAADANCTGGGWRTLNIRKASIASASIASYTWHLYDGYFTTTSTSNTTVSTPLSNFIKNDATKQVLIRTYSTTTGTTATHLIDWASISMVVDPIYMPAGFTQISGAAVTSSYTEITNGVLPSQTTSNNTYLTVAGTAGSIADFYNSFTNVKTYSGMNTILLRAEYACTTTGINIKPKIYNFNTSSWEDMTSTTIACSATDVTNQFVKNNITISDYVSNGELRIGWYGSANSTVGIRLDMEYIMLGTTNTDSSLCEISFGTGTATNCTNARTYDSTANASTWQPTTILESAATSSRYALDNDADATGGEAAWSVNSTFSASLPTGTWPTAMAYATAWRASSTVATVTTQAQLKDTSGFNATISGGWTAVGTTNASTTYTYQDPITQTYLISNPDDYIDTSNNTMNMRIRTTTSTAVANMTGDVDFMMVSLQWIEPPVASVPSITFDISDATVGFGSLSSSNARYATGDEAGSASDSSSAHTISLSTNAPTGYSLLYSGNTLTSGANTIDVASITDDADGTPGTEQFGLSVSTDGSSTIASGYDHNVTAGNRDWSWIDGTATEIASKATEVSSTETFSAYYLSNIATDTPAGAYSSTITYIATGNF